MFSRILAKSGRIAGAEIFGLCRPLIALALFGGMAFGQAKPAPRPSFSTADWGAITTPVYNHAESNPFYSIAEILAGPNKFGSYYAGVLPNGRKVTPAGASIQIGMNPLGVALTPDGKYVVTSNDDEREGAYFSYQSPINLGGYSLTVIDPTTFTVVSQYQTSAKFFVGLQISGPVGGPYTVWAAGGPDNDVKLFSLSSGGVLTKGSPANIVIFAAGPFSGVDAKPPMFDHVGFNLLYRAVRFRDLFSLVKCLTDSWPSSAGRSQSFVSVTQAFNTTTSMGRLTLNVLLSLATMRLTWFLLNSARRRPSAS